MKNLKLLDQSVLRYYRTKDNLHKKLRVAVVGNSGVDARDNKAINECDIVIRFNNYGTRAGIAHTQDKLKCDILFSTFDLHSQGSKPKDVVIGIPYPFKAKEIYPKPTRWYPEARPWMINPYENMNLCEEMGIQSLGSAHPLPSIGLTALWHIHNWKADFYVCGFKWYYDEKTGLFQGHHLSNKKYPTFWNHNYPKEVEWTLKTLLPKNNINFSDSCLSILKTAKHQLSQ